MLGGHIDKLATANYNSVDVLATANYNGARKEEISVIEDKETGMNLGQLKAGESCVVNTVGGEGALRQHFLDMGIIPGAEITIVKFAPMGDPVEVSIHGYFILCNYFLLCIRLIVFTLLCQWSHHSTSNCLANDGYLRIC